MERRRKATLPAVLGTPEHCGLIRRDLVVCPPFWLLPRIETGDSFLWACCAPLLRLHPQENVPAWAFAGRAFRRLWGMSVPFSLSAPLLCQIIVAILCGNFEQFANKRPRGCDAMQKSPRRPAMETGAVRLLYLCFFKRSRNYLRGDLIAACAGAKITEFSFPETSFHFQFSLCLFFRKPRVCGERAT